MTISQLGGHKATARGKDPSLQFDLNTQPGDANIKSVTVTLPRTFEIDQEHLGNLCDKAELERERCAGRQPIGAVKDETPLLEAPLEGLAYAVSGFGGSGSVLPHVVFILGGQVTVMPEGESVTGQRRRATHHDPHVPDVPIGHFRLTLYGGGQGYLSNTQSLCASPIVSSVQLNGQNGKTVTEQVKAKTACKAKHHKRSKRHRAKAPQRPPLSARESKL